MRDEKATLDKVKRLEADANPAHLATLEAMLPAAPVNVRYYIHRAIRAISRKHGIVAGSPAAAPDAGLSFRDLESVLPALHALLFDARAGEPAFAVEVSGLYARLLAA